MLIANSFAVLSDQNWYKIIFILLGKFVFIFGMKISTLEVKLIIIYKIILIKAKVRRICSNFPHNRKNIEAKNKSKEKKNTGAHKNIKKQIKRRRPHTHACGPRAAKVWVCLGFSSVFLGFPLCFFASLLCLPIFRVYAKLWMLFRRIRNIAALPTSM